MPTVFDSHFASAGFPMLLQQFGESITYLPHAGGSRPILAIVERDPPAVLDAAGNAVFPRAVVRVYNSCRSGIASSEVDIGKDEIEMPKQVGDQTPSRFGFMRLESQDSGVTVLAVV